MQYTSRGFSLLELILILLLMGIIMGYFLPRSPINTFHLYTETQAVLHWLQRAHRLSLQLGCQVRVQRTNNQLSLHYNGTPTYCKVSDVVDPITGQVIDMTVHYAILSGTTGWTYTTLGKPIEGQQALFLNEHTIHIEAETGAVWIIDNE